MRNMNTKINDSKMNYVDVTYNPHNKTYGYNKGNNIIDWGFPNIEIAVQEASEYCDEEGLRFETDVFTSEEIKDIVDKNPFVTAEFHSGDKYTIKAYGEELGTPYGSEKGALNKHLRQLALINYETTISNFIVANTREKAIEIGALDENGEYYQ